MPMPRARCVRPPPAAQRAAFSRSDMRAPLQFALRLTQGLLWLAVSAGSAVLIFWLYVDPVYGRPWSSEFGALLFAVLSFYAGVGWLTSLIDVERHGGVGR